MIKSIRKISILLLLVVMVASTCGTSFAETAASSNYTYNSTKTVVAAPPAYEMSSVVDISKIEGVGSLPVNPVALFCDQQNHMIYYLDQSWIASEATPVETEPDETSGEVTADATADATADVTADATADVTADVTEEEATPEPTEEPTPEPAEPDENGEGGEDGEDVEGDEDGDTEDAMDFTPKGRLLIFSYEPHNPDKWTLVKSITDYTFEGTTYQFCEPQGLFVDNDGTFYVCDTNNSRIVHFDSTTYEVKRLLGAPESDLFDSGYVYYPLTLVVDEGGRLYVAAKNVTSGLLKFDSDGNFTAFFGRAKVRVQWYQVVKRWFMTREQKAREATFSPSEYSSVTIDDKSFIYVTSSSVSEYEFQAHITAGTDDDRYASVKRLNPLGNDVLYRTSWFAPGGDVTISYYSTEQKGVSRIVDVALLENGENKGIYSILDSTRGRVFTYDADGNLLYIFGGKGIRAGTFKKPVAVEYIGTDIMVLDQGTGYVSLFQITDYGSYILKALALQDAGHWDEAAEVWQEIIKYHNANFQLAYIGVGRVEYMDGKYDTAMKYFKLGDKKTNYSNAWKQRRRELIDGSFGYAMTGILVLVVAIVVFKKVRKRQIFKKYGPEGKPAKDPQCMSEKIKFAFHNTISPVRGFYELKTENRGSPWIALGIVALTIFALILNKQVTAFTFNPNDVTKVNVWVEFLSVLGPLGLWIISNWCTTTLLDGEGKMKEIAMASCYSLLPIPLLYIPNVLLSYCLILEEGGMHSFLLTFGLVWAGLLIVIGTMITHQYSFGKTILVIFVILFAAVLIVFIGVLFFSIIQQVWGFIYVIYRELSFR